MRLIEEQKSQLIEIFSLCVIIISSIFLQIADIKIKDHNDKILTIELKRSNQLQMCNYFKRGIEYWELSGLIGQLGVSFRKEIEIFDDPVADKEHVDKDETDLMNQYKTKKINANEYIEKMGNYYRKKKEKHANILNKLTDDINSKIKNPPTFFGISIFVLRNILIFVQLVGVCVVIWLHRGLYLSIKERISSKK